MTVIVGASSAPEVLSTLRFKGQEVEPTERWGGHWRDDGRLTTNPCVYAIYGREIAVSKWLNDRLREMIERYPGDVGGGSMPGGMDPFIVPDTHVEGLGPWVMVYAGESGNAQKPRVENYFGVSEHLSRNIGGQSFHLMLALLFGLPVDPRVRTDPPERTLVDVIRGSLSVSLEARLREMRIGVVQVETPDRQAGEQSLIRLVDEESRLQGARPFMNSEW